MSGATTLEKLLQRSKKELARAKEFLDPKIKSTIATTQAFWNHPTTQNAIGKLEPVAEAVSNATLAFENACYKAIDSPAAQRLGDILSKSAGVVKQGAAVVAAHLESGAGVLWEHPMAQRLREHLAAYGRRELASLLVSAMLFAPQQLTLTLEYQPVTPMTELTINRQEYHLERCVALIKAIDAGEMSPYDLATPVGRLSALNIPFDEQGPEDITLHDMIAYLAMDLDLNPNTRFKVEEKNQVGPYKNWADADDIDELVQAHQIKDARDKVMITFSKLMMENPRAHEDESLALQLLREAVKETDWRSSIDFSLYDWQDFHWGVRQDRNGGDSGYRLALDDPLPEENTYTRLRPRVKLLSPEEAEGHPVFDLSTLKSPMTRKYLEKDLKENPRLVPVQTGWYLNHHYTRDGDTEMYLFLFPDKAITEYPTIHKIRPDYRIENVGANSFVMDYSVDMAGLDIRVQGIKRMMSQVKKDAELAQLIEHVAEQEGVPAYLLNILAGAVYEMDVPLPEQEQGIPARFRTELPFKRQEDEEQEMMTELELMIEQCFHLQPGENYELLTDALWTQRCAAVYDSIKRCDPDYQDHFIRPQKEALEQVLTDPAFFRSLSGGNMVALGASRDSSEARIMKAAREHGVIYEEFGYIDLDTAAYAEAVCELKIELAEEGIMINGPGITGKIGSQSIEELRKALPEGNTTLVIDNVPNFDEVINRQADLYGELIESLRPGDSLVIINPIGEPHPDTYLESASIVGPELLAQAHLNPKRWAWNGIKWDGKRSFAQYRCYEDDRGFRKGETLNFLQSSRRTAADVLDELYTCFPNTPKVAVAYRNATDEFETVVLRLEDAV